MNLFFSAPCTTTSQGIDYSYSNLTDGTTLSSSFTFANSDYGCEIDITKLDNSFNMKMNGTQLFSQKLQFQSGVSGSPQNIQFQDGTIWGTNGMSQIYNMTGTNESILKLLITSTGVTLLGSKNSNGGEPFYPLQLFGGTTASSVTWNASGGNYVVAPQLVTGQTGMTATVIRRQKTTCGN